MCLAFHWFFFLILRNYVSGFSWSVFCTSFILTMPRPAKTASAAFTLSAPPPPPRLRQRRFPLPFLRFRVVFPALPLLRVFPPPLWLVAQGMAPPRLSTSVALLWSTRLLYFVAFSRIWKTNNRFPSAVSTLASVQANTSLVYSAAPVWSTNFGRRFTSRYLTPFCSGKRVPGLEGDGGAGASTP